MCYRVSKLITFADYLCGIEPPMLDYDTRTAQYKSVMAPPSLSEKTTSNLSTQHPDEVRMPGCLSTVMGFQSNFVLYYHMIIYKAVS